MERVHEDNVDSQISPLHDDEFENVKARVAELMQEKYAI
jgi:hypothetical protein